jgi:hypothetical protein
MDITDIILESEEALAREVALGVIVKRPPPLWLSIIPGMFIFDFLRRTAAIRKYTRYYLFICKQALTVAGWIHSETDKTTALEQVEMPVKSWMISQGCFHEKTFPLLMEMIGQLAGHYARLMRNPVNDYAGMVLGAYTNRDTLNHFLDDLARSEKQLVDEILIHCRPAENIGGRMKAEQEEAAQRRQKRAVEIFT